MAVRDNNQQDHRRRKSFHVLVVEDNQDHQLLFEYSLRAKMPHAQPIFTSNVEDTLMYLQATAIEEETFPSLVLLDLYLPDLTLGWQLLQEMRKLYPRLPVVVLSSYHDADVVEKAYELGAHSFIHKPLNLDEWEYYFRVLNEYWLGTVTLPSSR